MNIFLDLHTNLSDAYNYSQSFLNNSSSHNYIKPYIFIIIAAIILLFLFSLYIKFYIHIKLNKINKHNENIELELKKLNQNLYNICCENKNKND